RASELPSSGAGRVTWASPCRLGWPVTCSGWFEKVFSRLLPWCARPFRDLGGNSDAHTLPQLGQPVNQWATWLRVRPSPRANPVVDVQAELRVVGALLQDEQPRLSAPDRPLMATFVAVRAPK